MWEFQHRPRYPFLKSLGKQAVFQNPISRESWGYPRIHVKLSPVKCGIFSIAPDIHSGNLWENKHFFKTRFPENRAVTLGFILSEPCKVVDFQHRPKYAFLKSLGKQAFCQNPISRKPWGYPRIPLELSPVKCVIFSIAQDIHSGNP